MTNSLHRPFPKHKVKFVKHETHVYVNNRDKGNSHKKKITVTIKSRVTGHLFWDILYSKLLPSPRLWRVTKGNGPFRSIFYSSKSLKGNFTKVKNLTENKPFTYRSTNFFPLLIPSIPLPRFFSNSKKVLRRFWYSFEVTSPVGPGVTTVVSHHSGWPSIGAHPGRLPQQGRWRQLF